MTLTAVEIDTAPTIAQSHAAALDYHAPAGPKPFDGIVVPLTKGNLDGLYAVALHASDDSASPQLHAVQVTARHFIATDRYTMAAWTHADNAPNQCDVAPPPAEAGDPEPVLIPLEAAQWLAKQTDKSLDLGNGTLRRNRIDTLAEAFGVIHFLPDSITVYSAGRILASVDFEPLPRATNFPPVLRLFPATAEEVDSGSINGQGVALGGEHLEKIIKGAKRAGDRNGPILFRTLADGDAWRRPMLVTFRGQPRFHSLVQPNMLQ